MQSRADWRDDAPCGLDDEAILYAIRKLLSPYAYVAHRWYPAAYEAMMIAGNDDEQSTTLKQMDDTMFAQVFKDRHMIRHCTATYWAGSCTKTCSPWTLTV